MKQPRPRVEAGLVQDPLELCAKIDVPPPSRALAGIAVVATDDELGTMFRKLLRLGQNRL